MDSFPEVGEIVVCKIGKILDYGVFVQLIEYSDLTGFVHISQVSSSWIKNIRNFVKENQIKVGQVIRVDLEKKQVDLSFNKVSADLSRSKLESFKQFKRSQKLMELIAAKNKASYDAVVKEVEEPLLVQYDSLFQAFQAILLGDKKALDLIPAKWQDSVLDIVEKNVEMPSKEIKGVLSLTSFESNGVEVIKSVISKSQKSVDNEKVSVLYLGSGKYLIKVVSLDFKAAEKVLKKFVDVALESIKSLKGVGSFSKE